jgi:hypothetical protein
MTNRPLRIFRLGSIARWSDPHNGGPAHVGTRGILVFLGAAMFKSATVNEIVAIDDTSSGVRYFARITTSTLADIEQLEDELHFELRPNRRSVEAIRRTYGARLGRFISVIGLEIEDSTED